MAPAPAADALLPAGATALEIPTDRPASIELFKPTEVLAPVTAVRRLADVSLPDSLKIYHNGSGDDSGVYYSGRLSFSCITPETAPCRAEPGLFIRRVFRTLALDLPQTFELLPAVAGFGDVPVLFRTPENRDAAMRRQPFVLDGVTVKLVPVQMILNVNRTKNGYMVLVALHDYPDQVRTLRKFRDKLLQSRVPVRDRPRLHHGAGPLHHGPRRSSGRAPSINPPRAPDQLRQWHHQRRPHRDRQCLGLPTLIRRQWTVRASLQAVAERE